MAKSAKKTDAFDKGTYGPMVDNKLTFLDMDGKLLSSQHSIGDERLVSLFKDMVRTRTFDEATTRLQRVGRIPAYYQCSGQETHVAVSSAIEEKDWIFSAYREQGTRLARGIPVINELALWRGMPHMFWQPTKYRITPMSTTIGTHLPHAVGYGHGARLLGRNEIAIALFGDGGTSEVDFHAALNFAGVLKAPTVFFCQNNQYAQSTPLAQQTASETLSQKADAYGIEGVRVDGMDIIAVHTALDIAIKRARSGEGATLIESVCYRYAAHSTYDGVPVYRERDEEAEWREKDPLIRARNYLAEKDLIDEAFEKQIVDEMRGEVDEAINALEKMDIPSREGAFLGTFDKLSPRLAEQLHEEQRFEGETLTAIPDDKTLTIEAENDPEGELASMTLVDALNSALDHGMATNDAMLNMGEDVGREGGVFRVTAGMYEKYGPDRMFDTPLCELGIIGTAVGMAMAGMRPVCEMEFAGFSLTAFDQINYHVGRYSWRTVGDIRLPIVIRMPAGGGHEAYEGHADSNEAFFMHSPGSLQIIYPSNAKDAKGLLASAMESADPVIFFEPIAKYFEKEEGIPVEHYTIPIGKARIALEGHSATIIAYGNAVGMSEKAAEILQEEGISVEIIDLRTLKPWDEEACLESIKKTGRLVMVHEAAKSASVGAEIVATLMEKGGDYLETPPVRVAHADIPYATAKLEPHSLIKPEKIAAAVRIVMED
jgi:2-oxoisovalerate dehydrogenase E1 component